VRTRERQQQRATFAMQALLTWQLRGACAPLRVCSARSAYEIKKLDCKDVTSTNPSFKKAGLTKMMQSTWLLTKKMAKA
jgi:hypothetical protein